MHDSHSYDLSLSKRPPTLPQKDAPWSSMIPCRNQLLFLDRVSYAVSMLPRYFSVIGNCRLAYTFLVLLSGFCGARTRHHMPIRPRTLTRRYLSVFHG